MASGAMKSTEVLARNMVASLLYYFWRVGGGGGGGGGEEKPHARLLFLLRAKLTFLPV